MAAPASHALWIGTYPAPGGAPGSGEGVWRVDVDDTGRLSDGRLVAKAPAPSFLAVHPTGRTLYAVCEDAPGSVSAFPVARGDRGGDDELAEPVTVASGGTFPCHLLALQDVLWIANYGDGVAATIPLDPVTGAFAADRVTGRRGVGSGPQVDRQEGPHAHFTARVGGDALVADLGADVIRRYPASPGLDPSGHAPAVAATLPAGTGPRHLVGLVDGALALVGELDASVHVLDPAGPGAWTPSSATPVTAGTPSVTAGTLSGEAGRSFPSHVTRTGDLVLIGVRGADSLAVHRMVPAARGVTLEPLADVALGAGGWPRHHEVVGTVADGRVLAVVANQGTSELVSVLVDPATGVGEVAARLPFPTPPACVVVRDARR